MVSNEIKKVGFSAESEAEGKRMAEKAQKNPFSG